MRTNGGHGSSVPCEEEENKGGAGRKREREKEGKEQGRKGAGHGLIRWWRLRSLAAAMGSWLRRWLAIGSGEKETGSRGALVGVAVKARRGFWIGEEADWIWIPRKIR